MAEEKYEKRNFSQLGIAKNPAPNALDRDAKIPKDEDYCIKNGAYVRVSEDGMEAWIYLNPPAKGENYYEKYEIINFLGEHGVKSGLHNSNIAAIAKKHVYGREILVAKGMLPVEGINGYYEFFFDTTDKKAPLIREDGSADYSAMAQLTSVEAGTKIAHYHRAVQGKNGYDVYGHETVCRRAKELPILRGRGIANEADPDVYYATISGEIDCNDNHIDIKNVHEVRGDVDLVTGKIEFFGDIHITGNVTAGVVIKASRNIIVDGVVEAATLYAGGDIVMKRGVQGNQKAVITARGDVFADFIEFATVRAGGDVRSNSILNSDVYAQGVVIAEGKNGLLLGGKVRGLLGVSALIIGNDTETKTVVISGYTANDYEHYAEASHKEGEVRKLLSDTVTQMTELVKKRRLGSSFNADALDKEIQALNLKKDECFEELDKVVAEKENLHNLIEKGKGGSIIANDRIFRGVTLYIEGSPMKIPENTRFMKYKKEAGSIMPSVIII